jgi:3-isopropylmalate/(R)-2-methylmalate dehydratase small subunit
MAKVILALGSDISTDIIYPGRYMATVLPSETPQYAFADLPVNKHLNAREIPPGSILVAGKNFGCGSSREQAASCLKGWELRIVAKGVARIFMQNAVNLGLDLVICPEVEAEDGDELEISDNQVINCTSGRRFAITRLPKARQAIIDAGGLIPYTRQLLKEISMS